MILVSAIQIIEAESFSTTLVAEPALVCVCPGDVRLSGQVDGLSEGDTLTLTCVSGDGARLQFLHNGMHLNTQVCLPEAFDKTWIYATKCPQHITTALPAPLQGDKTIWKTQLMFYA